MNILEQRLPSDRFGHRDLLVRLTVKEGSIIEAKELGYVTTTGSMHFFVDIKLGGEVIIREDELTGDEPETVMVRKTVYDSWATTGSFPRPADNTVAA
ncbi:MAG TPA: hypothetical protein VLA88_02640 [Candidatus Saccharimonadales bacterium]|nr:hypothetical protein [Candidatus Saccharimonadales bacterium]